MNRSMRLFLFLVLAVTAGCSDSDKPTKPRADSTPPAPVTDLAASNPTTTSIVLTWTAPGDNGATGTASAYDIRYSTSQITDENWSSASETAQEPAPLAAGTEQSFTVAGLAPGTTYYFCMKTADEVPNLSEISNVASGATLQSAETTPPGAVQDLAAGSATPVSLALSWTAVGDDGTTGTASSYDIRYATTAVTPWEQMTAITGEPVPMPAGAAEDFVVTGLSPATTYYFRMKVADEVPNVSGVSNQASGTTLPAADTTPPGAVQDLAAGSATAASVTLSWTAVGDDGTTGTASSYDIRYATAAATAWEQMTETNGEPTPGSPGGAESFVVTGLSPATTYYFRVKTADEVPNVSGVSNQASAATLPVADTTSPGAVQDLAVDSGTTTTLTLSWTAVGDDGTTGTAASYDLRYATSPATAWEQMTQVTGEPAPGTAGHAENFVVTALSPETTYYFQLKTADEVPNVSGASNVASGTTLPPPDVTPPNSVQTLAAGSATSSSLTLSWTAVGDDGATGTASAYDIRYTTVLSMPWEQMTQVTGEPAPGPSGQPESFVVTGLSAGTVYYFRLEVADEVPNWSAVSNEAVGATSIFADTTPPGAVQDLSAGSAAANSLTLSWTAVGDDGTVGTAASYDVRYATAAGTPWEAMTEATGEPAPGPSGQQVGFVVTGLSTSTTYFFRLKTADEVPNWSDESNEASETTTTPDTTPPNAVITLAAGSATSSSLTLTWTAVGDDDMTGTASAYDIRYTTVLSTPWEQMTEVSGEPAPATSGQPESFVVTGLAPTTVYYFRLRVADEVPNWSGSSNEALGSTSF